MARQAAVRGVEGTCGGVEAEPDDDVDDDAFEVRRRYAADRVWMTSPWTGHVSTLCQCAAMCR